MKEYIKGLWINEEFFNEDDIELRRDGVTYIFSCKNPPNTFWCKGLNCNVIKCNDNTVFEWKDNIKYCYECYYEGEIRFCFQVMEGKD